MAGRRDVDLNPGTFWVDSRPHLVSENCFREPHHFFRQGWILGRVLDCVCRQSAAVSDQMPKESKLLSAHRVLLGSGKESWQRNSITRRELVQASPAFHRQEFVICGRSNAAAEIAGELENRLAPRREGVGDPLCLHPPPTLVQSKHAKATLAHEGFD